MTGLDKVLGKLQAGSKVNLKKELEDKPKILVVDDNPTQLESLEMLLRDKYQLIKATSGEEALLLYQQNRDICLAVLDIRMPNMDGRELAVELDRLTEGGYLEKIIRTAHMGNYGRHELVQQVGSIKIVDKTEEGNRKLLEHIEQTIYSVNQTRILLKGEDKPRKVQEGLNHVPSIIGEDVNYTDGKQEPIFPFFADKKDRKPIGSFSITPPHALQYSHLWADKEKETWKDLPMPERISRIVQTGQDIKEYVKLAESFDNGNSTKGQNESNYLEFIAKSGGFPKKLLIEGIKEVADWMIDTQRIAFYSFGKLAVMLDGFYRTVHPKGVVGGVTRITMPHTDVTLTIPAAWTGNLLVRRGDSKCPGMSYFYQKMLMANGVPTQLFFSESRDNKFNPTLYLHRLTNYFAFMGRYDIGMEIAYGDLIQSMIDNGEEDKVQKILEGLQAPVGVGLYVAHEGFDVVLPSANLRKAAQDNAHGANCYVFSCKKTYAINVDPKQRDKYLRLQIKETERLMKEGMVQRPNPEYLRKIEDPYLRMLQGNDGKPIGEIIYGAGDDSLPKIILLNPEYANTEAMLKFLGTECHSNVTSIMPMPATEFLKLLRKSALRTQRSLKMGDTPRFLELNAHFDEKDPEGWKFFNYMVRQGIAYGSQPNMRTTHVVGNPKKGYFAQHEGGNFQDVLTFKTGGMGPPDNFPPPSGLIKLIKES